MLRDLFAQPLPEALNGIEVGTVAREREQLKPRASAAVRTFGLR